MGFTLFHSLSNTTYFESNEWYNHFSFYNITIASLLILSSISFVKLFSTLKSPKILLVDFACYKPKDSLKCSYETFMERSRHVSLFSSESLEFQKNILDKSGLGQSTYFPEALWRIPPNPCMAEARIEAETVLFGAVDALLAKSSVKANDIGIVIVNSSLFTPVPCLTSMIINHYKLRSDVLSYNLSGMGCNAAPISIDLAKNLLKVHPDSLALVLSTENITLNWYWGNNRSMLVSNCLFRMGASAILLSNRLSDQLHAKYQLKHIIRTHKGTEDRGYFCTFQEEDSNGTVGFSLSKELYSVAEDALKTNIRTLGPLALPLSEYFHVLKNTIARKIFKMDIRPYVPNFELAFEHFCVHPGGRAVLDKVEKSLSLSSWHLEPSRTTLYRFGNTSSSSLFYELAYSEAKGRIKKGDRVWQIAFGAGFKCNSAVWKALRTIDPAMETNPWIDEIEKFPV